MMKSVVQDRLADSYGVLCRLFHHEEVVMDVTDNGSKGCDRRADSARLLSVRRGGAGGGG